MTDEERDNIAAIEWRINYLALRVEIKKQLGADWQYDERERRAHIWSLERAKSYRAHRFQSE